MNFLIPMVTISAANARECWGERAKRTKAQRRIVALALASTAAPLLLVRLTRQAPRPLDDDNLRGALKAARDEVAAWLGSNDRNPLVAWEYAQAQGEPAVRVEVEVMHRDCPEPLEVPRMACARRRPGLRLVSSYIPPKAKEGP